MFETVSFETFEIGFIKYDSHKRKFPNKVSSEINTNNNRFTTALSIFTFYRNGEDLKVYFYTYHERHGFLNL